MSGSKRVIEKNLASFRGRSYKATCFACGFFTRPRVCDDNPYSEALFRTVKYRSDYPHRPFESLEAARQWVGNFVRWYNDEHRHSAIRFVTPSQRHSGEEMAVLREREEVYKKAREQNPSRWTGSAREWKPIEKVVLNPSKIQADYTADLQETA